MNSFKTSINMLNKSFLSKIAANFVLVAVLLVTTISNPGDRLDLNANYTGHDSLGSATLIAAANKSETSYPTNDKNMGGLLYDGDEAESLNSVDDFVAPSTQDKLLDPTQIPAVKQPIIDRSNPDNKLLEKTGQMFDDSGVLSDK